MTCSESTIKSSKQCHGCCMIVFTVGFGQIGVLLEPRKVSKIASKKLLESMKIG